MVTYHVVRVKDREDFIKNIDNLPRAYVTHYPWDCKFRPETYACLAWDGDNLHLYMRSYEDSPRDETDCDNGDIYMDSCMEFFINPVPDKTPDFFINMEVNPRRYVYLASGDPYNRVLLKSDKFNRFGLEILDKGDWNDKVYWDLTASIPLAFFKEQFPEFDLEPGMKLRGNFFKCGDGTPIPHFGCWSEITNPDPEPFFYRPECFGELFFM